jgi:hypothetical protein
VLEYDKVKDREMLLEAAETILEFFGFDRNIYGNTRKKIENGGRYSEKTGQEILRMRHCGLKAHNI